MGELKQLSEEQKGLVERVKDAGRKVYLANLGLVSKVEEEGKKQFDKVLAAGEQARGEEAAQSNKAVLVAFGVVETLKTEADKLILDADTLRAKFETTRAKLQGLNLKEEALSLKGEAQKLFDELVAAGEKRTAA